MFLFTSFYVICFLCVFFVGSFGILINRKNIIIVLLSIEIILLSVNLFFIFSSFYLDDFIGQIFAFFVLTVAAAESAIGLAVLVAYFRVHGTISSASLTLLHG